MNGRGVQTRTTRTSEDGVNGQMLSTREIFVQHVLLRTEAGHGAQWAQIRHSSDVVAVDQSATGSRSQGADQRVDSRSFTRSIVTEQTCNFTC